MASTKLSDVSAALSLVYRRPITTQINSVAVLPFLLPVLMGEGKSLNWTAEVSGAANAVAATEAAGRSATNADAEAEVAATLPWAIYDKVSSVSGLAQAAAGSNFNPESIGSAGRDLLSGRVQRQGRRMGLGIATNCYNGNSGATPPQIAGAALAIDSSDDNFAGIDTGDHPEWNSAENTAALADISFQKIRESLLTPIYDACGEAVEFMTCPSNIFDKVKALFGDNEKAVQEFTVGRGGGSDGMEPRVVKLNAGMDAVSVDGVPLVRDRQCTANTIYGWNTNYVALRQLDPIASAVEPGTQGVLDFFRRITDNPFLQLPREVLEGMAARSPGIKPHIKVLGAVADSTEVLILAYCQMEWIRRNAFGKLTFS